MNLKTTPTHPARAEKQKGRVGARPALSVVLAMLENIFYTTTPSSMHSPRLNSESITALLVLLSLSCNSI